MAKPPDFPEAEIARLARELYIARAESSQPGTADEDWSNAEATLRARRKLKRGMAASLAAWMLITTLLIISTAQQEPSTPAALEQLGSVLVYQTTTDGCGQASEVSTFWDRAKAVEFGMSQLFLRLNAVLAAAGAVLWFALKALTPDDGKARGSLPALLVLWNAVLASAVSITMGFMGLLFLADLAVQKALDLNGEIASCAVYQVLTFFVAGALLLIAVVFAVPDRFYCGPAS